MDLMNRKFALIAILATALALPASGALARGGGFGGGHMGGGFGGGHMGGIGGAAAGAFGSAGASHERGGHMGSFGDHRGVGFASHGLHHRRFIGGGFDGTTYDSCPDWLLTQLGWVCQYPDYE